MSTPASPVTADPGAPTRRARPVVPLLLPSGPDLLAALPELADALAGRGPARLPVPADDPSTAARLIDALAAGPLGPGEDDPADPTAVVVGTSGSTGPPKGALLPVSALAASAAATAERLAGPGPSAPGSWLLTVPAYHVAGLQVLLRSVAAGTEPVVLAPPFRAEGFAAAAGRLPAGPRFVSLVPTQLSRVLEHPGATAALVCFDAVLVGGAATDPVLLARARAAGARVVTTYGMSETCGGCVYDGVPLTGVTAELSTTPDDGADRDDLADRDTSGTDRDASGTDRGPGGGVSDPGGVGVVRLRGPVLARGYRGRVEDPAFGTDDRGRWFRTADLARWSADRRLLVVGRVDDVLVSGGEKVHPVLVETALAGVPGVRSAVVVGVPDDRWGQLVVAVVVLAPSGRLDEGAIAAAARAAGGRTAVPRVILPIDELPMRGPGKPDRAALTAWAAARMGRRA